MTSDIMKSHLLSYYRFKRSMFVGTECYVSYGIADILAISQDKKRSIEIEIKVSLADFGADFREKKSKHHYMKESKNLLMQPDYFLFAVPRVLREKILKRLPVYAGLLVVEDNGDIIF